MNRDLQSELQQHLDQGEHLIWAEHPKKGIVFRSSDAFMIPFSIFWCGFSVFWLVSSIMMGAPFFFSLFGVPFVIIGLMMVFGRFILDARHRANTIYGITENRIIIKNGLSTKKVKSLDISSLSQIEYTEKGDGSGTISFGPKGPGKSMAKGMEWMPGAQGNPELTLIPEVRKVYKMISDLQKPSF